MKRFMKGCAITALVFGALGCVLAMVGGSVVGRTTVSQVVDSVTRGKVKLSSNNWWNWELDAWGGLFRGRLGDVFDIDQVEKAVDEGYQEWDDFEYETGNEVVFDNDHDIRNGNVEKYCPGSNVRKLDIEVGGCHLYTERSEDEFIYLEAENAYKFQGYIEGDTLYVKSVNDSLTHWNEGGERRIILYLPEGYRFDEVDIAVGAGYLQLDSLYAQEASLEAGAGEISLQDIQVQELDVSIGAGAIDVTGMKITKLDAEVGMGTFTGEGELYGDADVECSMGYVEMSLAGNERDFNYSLEGAMGTIDIGSSSFGGLGEEREIDNHANKNINVECSMGNILISFTN